MKFICKLLIRKYRKEGYSAYFAPRLIEERFNDLFNFKETTWKQKIWAQKRGFFSEKILNYGLTENNYQDYLSDFDYYWIHPINGQYSHWIDDKLTMRFLLQPFSKYFPKYYYHIYKTSIYKLMDCPTGYYDSLEDVLKLLKLYRTLALKAISGTLAEGFYKLTFMDNQYSINNKLVSEDEVRLFFKNNILPNNYLITEYLLPSKEIRKIWNQSPNTLRIMVINEPYQGPEIIRAYWRFGTNLTGVVDNPAVGGVISNVNVNTGIFEGGSKYENDILIECKSHPDSGELIKGSIENWVFLREKILEISKYVPEICYFGFDVILTDQGFKIIEINSHQGIKYLQHFEPLLINKTCNKFFQCKIEEKKKYIRRKKSKTIFNLVRRAIRRLSNKLSTST